MPADHFALQEHLHFKRNIYKQLRMHFPTLLDIRHRHLLLLFCRLLRAPRDATQNYLLLSCDMMSHIYHATSHGARDHHLHLARDLDTLCHMTGSDIRWLRHDWGKGRARRIYEFRLSPEMAQTLYPAQTAPLLRDGLVNLVTGKIIPPVAVRRYTAARYAAAAAHNAACPLDEHREWLTYLNTTITARVLHLQPGPLADAMLVVETLGLTDIQRQWAREALQRVAWAPCVPYRWVAQSPRLYQSGGTGVSSLSQAVRNALLPDAAEVDLRHCQLSIFAGLFWVESLRIVLAANASLWSYLARAIGIDARDANKRVLKTILYSLLFGCASHTLFWASRGGLTDAMLAPFTAEVRARFYQLPMIHDLLLVREAQLRNIRLAGGMRDAYGRWIATETGVVEAKSVLAQVVQSWEMRLLEPLRVLTRTEGRHAHGWWVVCWQHDGCSIKVKDHHDREAILRKLIAAVNAHATALGFPTSLEVSYRPH